MTVYTAALSTLAIGTTTVVNNQADYEADSYAAVGEVEDLGEFGDTAEEITFTSLADRRVRKFKGSFNAGTLTVTVGKDTSDSGQAAMIAAFASDDDYNFRVQLNDTPVGGTTPTTLYFSGKVMSIPNNVGNVSNVVRQMFTVGINTEILEVAAS